MIRKFVLAAVVGTTVLSGGVAFAAQAQISAAGNYAVPRGPMRADANHDGIVTRAEAMAEGERMFAMRDTNRDGRLTGAEMGRSRGTGTDGTRSRGPDGSGREITKAKFERKVMRRFDRFDANRDGQIASAEIKAHRQKMRSQRRGSAQSGADYRG